MGLTNLSRTPQVNLAINGNLDFWQRIEGTTVTVSASTATTAVYTADMIQYSIGGTTAKSFTVAQSSNVPSVAQSSFVSTFSLLFTMTTGIASFAAGDFIVPFQYNMEGLDFQSIHQQTVTYGFWINASIAGTYSFFLQNAAVTRSYVTTFTVNSPSTWQFVSITVQMDTGGTWVFNNARSLAIGIAPVAGSTNTTSTLNVWQSGAAGYATGSTNWAATSGATVSIAQFSIVLGSTGFTANTFSRAGVSFQKELALCQRYYQKGFPLGTAPATGAGTTGKGMYVARFASTIGTWAVFSLFPVQMRTSPTVTTFNPVSANSNWRDFDNNVDVTSAGPFPSPNGTPIYALNQTNTAQVGINWTAEAGL